MASHLAAPCPRNNTHTHATVVTAVPVRCTDTVLDTVLHKGNVLLPCDASGRVLELALQLDQARVPCGSPPFSACIGH